MNDETDKENLDLSLPFRGTGGIIYNVTVKVEQSVANEWLHWLLREHIPAMMQTNCFVEYRLVRLLEVDDNEGPTYAIQYYAASKADYNRYREVHAAKMDRLSFERWGEQFIAFGSVMEVMG